MSFSYVRIYYGPCDSFHTVTHKPQKLRGLKERLRKRGYRVDMVPVEYINHCMLEMCGHEIFRCNVKNLHFNTPYESDPVCQRAVAAVEESSAKFRRARSYLWFWTLLEKEIFQRSQFAPQDHWPESVHFGGLAPCTQCAQCCKILITEKESQ